jgi:hypothetical protein
VNKSKLTDSVNKMTCSVQLSSYFRNHHFKKQQKESYSIGETTSTQKLPDEGSWWNLQIINGLEVGEELK